MNIRLLTVLLGFALCASLHAAPPIAAYGRLGAIESMSLSPSGERLAFVSVAGETRVLAVRDVGGKVLCVANVADSKLRDVSWAGADHVLVTMSTTFKAPLMFRHAYELSGVISIRLPDCKVVDIFRDRRDIAHAVFGYYGTSQRDGHSYGYFGGITYGRGADGSPYFEDGHPDLYRVDLDTGGADRVDTGDGADFTWVVAADGGVLAHSEYRDKSGTFSIFAGTDRRRLLLEKPDPLGMIGLIGVGTTARSLLYEDDSGESDRSIELDIESGQATERCGQRRVARYAVDPSTGLLLGCISDDEGATLFFDPAHQARFSGVRKAFTGKQVRLVSLAADLQRLIVFTDGADDAGTYWMIDFGTRQGNATPLGRAYPDIEPAQVARSSWFDYTAADGLPLQGVLTLPPGRTPRNLPLVMMPHGGPIGPYDKPGFDWWAQAYASRGYAVFQPNFRGSGGYSTAFRNAGMGEFGGRILSDVADGLQALTAAGIVDPKRACIVGASYGGYAALAGVTLQQGLYRCAVSVAGVTDLRALYRWKTERDGGEGDAARFYRSAYGVTAASDPKLEAHSPARQADQADAPILLMHGKDDTVVPLAQSELMADALKDAGKHVEFELMDGEDHWLSREKTRIRMLERSVAFLEKHIPPD